MVIKDATTSDNAFGFGRTVLDMRPVFDAMTNAEYMAWCFGTFDVKTREEV